MRLFEARDVHGRLLAMIEAPDSHSATMFAIPKITGFSTVMEVADGGEQTRQQLESAFGRLGLDAVAARYAAAGRGGSPAKTTPADEHAGKPLTPMAEAFRRLGLSEAEARIAAGVGGGDSAGVPHYTAPYHKPGSLLDANRTTPAVRSSGTVKLPETERLADGTRRRRRSDGSVIELRG